MAEQRISKRYARAIINTATETGELEIVFNDLKKVSAAVKDSRELEIYLKSPLIRSLDKKKALKEIFDGKISKLSKEFLNLLAHKGRERYLSSIVSEFMRIYNERNNILPVEVTTAVEINEDIKQNILSEIHDRTGMKLQGTFSIDPAIKGGVMIKMDDMIIDASLRSKLKDLYQRLSTGEAA